jgi:heme A synthase
MSSPPGWATKAVGGIAVIALIVLVIQYLVGMWTNLYSPATFTTDSSYPALDAHYNLGFALGIIGIIGIVFAAITRNVRMIAPAVGLFVWIFVAGFAGMAFVSDTPNNPVYSFVMSVAFLLAFVSALALLFQSMGRFGWRREPVPPTATAC